MGLIERLTALENKALDAMRSSAADSVASTTSTGSIDDLGNRQYCVLVSYRKDGTPVPSPLWFALADGKLYTHTGGWKVKRMQRNPAVLVAPCTFRGRPTGPPFAGTARTVPRDSSAAAVGEQALKAKYGLTRKLYYRFFAQIDLGDYIEVTPNS